MNKENKQNQDFLSQIKKGIQREWERTKKERREYIKNSKGSFIKKVPNFLTRLRILGSFIIPFLAFINPVISIITAIGIALTDFLDGIIARKWNATSKYGALLDTIADKLLSISLVCALAKVFPIYAASILMGEALIVGTNVIARISGRETKSSLIGKLKTWPLSISPIIGVVSILYPKLQPLAQIGFLITLGFQAVTIVDYNTRYFIIKEKREKKKTTKEIHTEKPDKKSPSIENKKPYVKTTDFWKQEKAKLLSEQEEKKEECYKKM